MQEIIPSERIFSGSPQGRADSWITIRHMHLWLSKERGYSMQPHGSNCESWCYRYVDSSCNHALLVHKGSMASSIPKGSNLRHTHHTNSIKTNSRQTDHLKYCPAWTAGQKKGRPKKQQRRLGITDHIKNSAKKRRTTGKKIGRRPLVMMGSHLYRRKTRSMKVWI
jgi:hypothetical protein